MGGMFQLPVSVLSPACLQSECASFSARVRAIPTPRMGVLPGQYYQAETGLNYNYFRDYDPQTGRYIESDPIGLGGGSYSTYAYANGNPVSPSDPLGLLV